ncbi:VOC family protein [Couchioplanes caeruleus]|uniref:Glyoxalase n=2 Tax=Couchioplanes caeruleus TaxID=56438 RepID=A0A1K0GP35_9ACTN|nr:VOC family protein [Couchioplanes caeruleus]OJF10963.1 glyoxalase [Couchioplanes caeruleus subsp. caeruleus]ROP29907.1 glyoxalase/bleomycin resistance protein/dioxygenase superfamily protein [Couchioplanes caeruleus]
MAPTFAAIGLAVADMGKSLAFYRRLGLDIPAGAEDAPHVEATLPGGVKVMWDTHETIRSFDPDFSVVPGAGRISLAFACAGPADVDRTHAALVEAGHESHLAPWDAPWGQRYAVVLDPDGNGVDLFAPLT